MLNQLRLRELIAKPSVSRMVGTGGFQVKVEVLDHALNHALLEIFLQKSLHEA
jgi:hypothetical protein